MSTAVAPEPRVREARRPRHPLARAILLQVLFAIATLALLTVITFAAMNRSPSTVARSALGSDVSQQQIDQYVKQNGLDDSIVVRYKDWVSGVFQGDLGTSSVTRRPVGPEIGPRFVRTLILAGATLLISVPLALGTAIFMARRVGRWPDTSLLVGTTVFTALPEFIVGILLIFVFGIWLGVLPVDSSALAFGSTGEKIKTYILPIATMTIVTVPYLIRIARASLRDSLNAEFTRAAVLRGLSRRTVVWNHAVRNSAIPIISSMALSLIYLIGGVVVVETVFGFPGIGQRLVEAVAQGDAVTVEAVALLMGAMLISLMLIADLLALYFDPRLRAR